MILAIDPGSTESAYVVLDEDLKPVVVEKLKNNLLLGSIYIHNETNRDRIKHVAIEMVASYGMPVGKEVFDTVFWIGRFWEAITFTDTKQLIYRIDEKIAICHSPKANDATIKQALVDRFAYGVPNRGKGKKDSPGWFYGFKDDIWQAYAVGVTYHDLYLKGA